MNEREKGWERRDTNNILYIVLPITVEQASTNEEDFVYMTHGVSLTFLLLFSFLIIKYSVQSHQVLFLGTDPKILADTEQVILSTV